MRHCRLAALLWVVLFSAGCRFVATDIGDIAANPSQYLGREVTVAGEASEGLKLPLLPGAHAIKDGTGRIMVVTSGHPPAPGARVRIRARVESAATIGRDTLGLHLTEIRR